MTNGCHNRLQVATEPRARTRQQAGPESFAFDFFQTSQQLFAFWEYLLGALLLNKDGPRAAELLVLVIGA